MKPQPKRRQDDKSQALTIATGKALTPTDADSAH